MRALDFILDNLTILLVVAGGIASWLTKRRQERGARTLAGPARPSAPPSRDEDLTRQEDRRPGGREREDDLETLERTRRIQEEIRRKIAERGGASRPSPGEPSPASRPSDEPPALPVPDLTRRPETSFPRRDPGRGEDLRRPVPASAPQHSPGEETVLARQRQLAEQLEELQRRRSTARTKPKPVATGAPVRGARGTEKLAAASAERGSPAGLGPHDVVTAVRDPHALRRAIVLREVLGPPVGLR